MAESEWDEVVKDGGGYVCVSACGGWWEDVGGCVSGEVNGWVVGTRVTWLVECRSVSSDDTDIAFGSLSYEARMIWSNGEYALRMIGEAELLRGQGMQKYALFR